MKLLDIVFTKIQGTGNNFLFVDLRSSRQRTKWKAAFRNLSRKRIARQLCNPFIGVGADGLAIIENTSKGAAVAWDFFNADGSRAEMCGNAARCAGLFLTQKNKLKKPFKMRTRAGVVQIQVHTQDRIEVEMTPVKKYEWNQSLLVNGRRIRYDFINSGVPHVVLKVKNLELTDKYRELALALQSNKRFGRQSTNVTFYEETGPRSVATASFERGVFDFTQACGTGAVAAALCFQRKSPHKPKKIRLRVPGGYLKVDLSESTPRLIGPARKIAEIKVTNF